MTVTAKSATTGSGVVRTHRTTPAPTGPVAASSTSAPNARWSTPSTAVRQASMESVKRGTGDRKRREPGGGRPGGPPGGPPRGWGAPGPQPRPAGELVADRGRPHKVRLELDGCEPGGAGGQRDRRAVAARRVGQGHHRGGVEITVGSHVP